MPVRAALKLVRPRRSRANGPGGGDGHRRGLLACPRFLEQVDHLLVSNAHCPRERRPPELGRGEFGSGIHAGEPRLTNE